MGRNSRRYRLKRAEEKAARAAADADTAASVSSSSAVGSATSPAPSTSTSIQKTPATDSPSVNAAAAPKPTEPRQGETPTNFSIDLSIPFRADPSHYTNDGWPPPAGRPLQGPVPEEKAVKDPLPLVPPGTFPTPSEGPLPLPSKGPAPPLDRISSPPSLSGKSSQAPLAQHNNSHSHIRPGYLNQPQGFAPILAQRGPTFQRSSTSAYSISPAARMPTDIPQAAFPGNARAVASPMTRRSCDGIQTVSPNFYRGDQYKDVDTLLVFMNMMSAESITLDANYDMDMKRLDNIRTGCRVWIDQPEGSEIKWLVLRAEHRSHLKNAIDKIRQMTKIDEDDLFTKSAYLVYPPVPAGSHSMILKPIGKSLWRGVAIESIPKLIDLDADEPQPTEKKQDKGLVVSRGGTSTNKPRNLAQPAYAESDLLIGLEHDEPQTTSAAKTEGTEKQGENPEGIAKHIRNGLDLLSDFGIGGSQATDAGATMGSEKQDDEDLIVFSDSSSDASNGAVKPSHNDERQPGSGVESKAADRQDFEDLLWLRGGLVTKDSGGTTKPLPVRARRADAPAETSATDTVAAPVAAEERDAEAENLSFFCGPFREEFDDIAKSFHRDPDGLHMRLHFGILTLTERPRTPDSWDLEGYKALLQKVGARATVKFEDGLGTKATAKGLITKICSLPDKFEGLFATDIKVRDALPKHILMVSNIDWLLELELEIPPVNKGKTRQARVCQTRAYRIREKDRHTEIRVSCPQKKSDWKLEVLREAQTKHIPEELLAFRDTIRFAPIGDERRFPRPIFDPRAAKAKKIEGVVGKTVWTYLVKEASCRLEVCLNSHCRDLDPALEPAVACGVSLYGTWWDDELVPRNIVLSPRDLGPEHRKLFPTFTGRHGLDVFGDCIEYIQDIIDEAPEVGRAST